MVFFTTTMSLSYIRIKKNTSKKKKIRNYSSYQTVDKVRGKPRAFLVEKTKKNTENTGFFSVFLI